MKKKIYEAPSLKVRKLRPVRILCASVSTELTGGSESVNEGNGYWEGSSVSGASTESLGDDESGTW